MNERTDLGNNFKDRLQILLLIQGIFKLKELINFYSP